MIRPEELRLYNITEQGLVIAISNYEFIVESKDDQFYSSNAVTINPIPLTEEWLVRFGFEYEAHTTGGFERWEIKIGKNRIKILDKKFSWSVGEYGPYIIHVHQLQNLIYALTGTELQIKDKV